jgi:hypothetical protein
VLSRDFLQGCRQPKVLDRAYSVIRITLTDAWTMAYACALSGRNRLRHAPTMYVTYWRHGSLAHRLVPHPAQSAEPSSFSLDSSSRARRAALSNTSLAGMPVLAFNRRVMIVPTTSARITTPRTTAVTMNHFASGQNRLSKCGFTTVPY